MPLVSKTFSQIITFTRASTATFFDSAGVLQSAAIDAPRFDYNPSTLAAQGLLIEEARTNSIRNNTMVGAVAGTPGTLPTNWSTNLSGLTREIVGTGTQNGITYIDIRLSGTTTSTGGSITFEVGTAVSATNGQSWAESSYISLLAGSIANITTIALNADQRDSGGVFLSGLNGTDIKSSISASLTRFSQVLTTNNASIAFIQPFVRFAWANGAAIDITLRIGLPQLEQGAFVTSVIPTTTTALTRAADVASVNTLSPWYNASAGTIYVEASIPFTTANSRGPIRFDDGTDSNRIMMRNGGAASRLDGRVVSGGSNVANLESAATAITANTTFKAALAYAVDDYSMSLNGGTPLTDTSGALPIGLSRLLIGNAENTTNPAGSLIRRITYYPRKLSSAELQAITT
jgi:hypothetical protein